MAPFYEVFCFGTVVEWHRYVALSRVNLGLHRWMGFISWT